LDRSYPNQRQFQCRLGVSPHSDMVASKKKPEWQVVVLCYDRALGGQYTQCSMDIFTTVFPPYRSDHMRNHDHQNA
jgi:hypothetical protein